MGWNAPGMAWNGPGMAWNAPGMAWNAPGMGWNGPGMAWNAPGMGWNAPGMPLECPWNGLECPWNGLECPWNGLECPWNGLECPWNSRFVCRLKIGIRLYALLHALMVSTAPDDSCYSDTTELSSPVYRGSYHSCGASLDDCGANCRSATTATATRGSCCSRHCLRDRCARQRRIASTCILVRPEWWQRHVASRTSWPFCAPRGSFAVIRRSRFVCRLKIGIRLYAPPVAGCVIRMCRCLRGMHASPVRPGSLGAVPFSVFYSTPPRAGAARLCSGLTNARCLCQ